ncbi:MAG: sporulation protein YabP [Clostridia bacterium]|nr:sporulation protein YabP [Clostridia bacterium]
MDEFSKKIPHSLILDDRKKLTLTGITDVGNFDEESMTVYTGFGEISVTGEKMQVTVLNVETGQFCAEGKIISIKYSDKTVKNPGFFSKVFK